MEHIVNWLLFGMFGLLYLAEIVFPGVPVRFNMAWTIRAGTINFLQLLSSFGAVYLLNDWLANSPAFQLPKHWNPALLGLGSFFISSFFVYWWHRFEHANSVAWRVFHQLHHSPSRIEVLTANYAHPLDFLAGTIISSVISFFLLGLDANAAAWAVLYSGAVNYLAHSNLKSPRWLGYVIQRPEMHRVHHQSDHHGQNYGLPIWDVLFGTWVNPIQTPELCGFSESNEQKVKEMLLCKNVHG